MLLDVLDISKGAGKTAVHRGDGSTPFHKQLRWLIANPPKAAVELAITPQMAAEMLAYNSDNRPLRQSHVKALARQMTECRWRLIKSPIVFSGAGRLLDGQHRLSACVESGVTIRAWVAFGDDDSNFALIDTGRPRGGGDVFAINGVANHNTASSVTRWVSSYDNGTAAGQVAGAKTAAELYEAYVAYDRIDDSVRVALRAANGRLPKPTILGGIHYVCARRSRAAADDFFNRLIHGVGLSARDPVKKLRDRLLRDAKEMNRTQLAADVILTWNATRQKKSSLRWFQQGKDRFPRAI